MSLEISVDIISDFLAESLKANKNQQKKLLILRCTFAQKTSLRLWISTHLTLGIICSRSTAKSLSYFTNFPANMFLCGVRKSIWPATFLDVQELHSWKTLKANVCTFLYISFKKFCSKDVLRFYLMQGGLGGGGFQG